MTDPENWPLWLKMLLFPPMVVGALSGWLPMAKKPKWRAVPDWFYCLFFLVRCLFRMEINNWVRNCGRGRLRVVGLLIPEMEKHELRRHFWCV
jgi:hypothetical protein